MHRYLQQSYPFLVSLFSFLVAAITDSYSLSLHDALPIFWKHRIPVEPEPERHRYHLARRLHHSRKIFERSEEHTSELQSRRDLVCRLLLEKKKLPPPIIPIFSFPCFISC